jgi:hypothetical protein
MWSKKITLVLLARDRRYRRELSNIDPIAQSSYDNGKSWNLAGSAPALPNQATNAVSLDKATNSIFNLGAGFALSRSKTLQARVTHARETFRRQSYQSRLK